MGLLLPDHLVRMDCETLAHYYAYRSYLQKNVTDGSSGVWEPVSLLVEFQSHLYDQESGS